MITLPFSAASDRNRHPILDQLKRLLSPEAIVLEIGSGWGQHAVFFSEAMPRVKWQPSDKHDALAELSLRLAAEGNASIRPPLSLNVLEDSFPHASFDAVYSANTAHIMSWEAVVAMFAGVGKCLKQGGIFCLYGPFNIDGVFTAPSNQSFDQSLKSSNPEMGIRDIAALESLACSHQLELQERISMPANNLLLVFEKCPD